MQKPEQITIVLSEFSEKTIIEKFIKRGGVTVKTSQALGLYLAVDTNEGIFHLKYIEAKQVGNGQYITYEVSRPH